MTFTLIISIIFGILALALGITDTYYAGIGFNKEDKNGIVNNNTPILFLFTGILITVVALFYIYIEYQSS